MAAVPTVVCVSIKKTYEADKPVEDFGFDTKPQPKEYWIVKFQVDLGGKQIKPSLGYETEGEARRFSEGHSYAASEWFKLAFA